MNEDVLRATVNDLISAFRDALIGFIPIADRLMMPWQDENQHRDWERVAEAMFDACVRGPIEAEATRSVTEYLVPRYDIDVDSYAAASWISVRREGHDTQVALVRLVTDRDPFDSVQGALIDPTTLGTIGRVEMPMREAQFSYIRRGPGAEDSELTTIVAVE
jgi:hypothetical protein